MFHRFLNTHLLFVSIHLKPNQTSHQRRMSHVILVKLFRNHFTWFHQVHFVLYFRFILYFILSLKDKYFFQLTKANSLITPNLLLLLLFLLL